jgi:hypothetical protein
MMAFARSLLISAVVLVAGCDLELDYRPDVGRRLVSRCDPSDSDPSVDVSFARDVHPLMTRTVCGCNCHLGKSTSGLDLSSYAALRRGGINSGSELIVPHDPCNSILVQKIGETPPFGARMPLNGPPHYAPEEVQLVHDWIAEGAEDN